MRTWWIPLATIGLLVTFKGDAAAYCLNIPQGLDKEVTWQTIPVTYQVSDTLTDAAMLQAIDDAFAAWGAVECSKLAFTKGAQFTICTESDKTQCAANTVHPEHSTPYINIFWYTSNTGFPTADSNAYYYMTWYGMIGSIEGATLAVNAFNFDWNATGGDTTTLDVQNELTYMIGMVIGLAASTVAGASLEKGITFGDTEKRSLEQDDKDGLVHLYKEDGCPDPPEPDPSCAGGTPPPPGDGGTTPGDGGGTTPGDGGGTTPGDGGGTTPGEDGGVVPGVDGGGTGTGCSSSAECAEDEVCTAEGICKKVGGDDDGCGCRIGLEQRGTGPLAVLVFILGLAVLGLRRRRPRS